MEWAVLWGTFVDFNVLHLEEVHSKDDTSTNNLLVSLQLGEYRRDKRGTYPRKVVVGSVVRTQLGFT